MRRPAIVFAVLVVAALLAGGIYGFLHLRRIEQDETQQLLADARAKLEAGRPDDAAGLFARYLGRRPNDAAARREYANIVARNFVAGRVKGKATGGAFRLIETALRENPDDHWLRLQLVRCLTSVGENTSALQHVEILRTSHRPGVDETQHAQQAKSADWKVTPRDIDAVAVDPLVKTGRFREALGSLSRLVHFDADTRRFTDDAETIRKHLGGIPGSSALFRKLAGLLENELDDVEAAGRVVAINAEVHPEEPSAWITLAGWKVFREKDVTAAIHAVEKATQLAPDDSDVMNANFMIGMQEKDGKADATSLVDRGLKLHPDKEWPYLAKATLLLDEKDVDGVLNALESGVKRLGGRQALLQMLADVPYGRDWDTALERTLASVGPMLEKQDDFRALFDGRVLMAKGRWLEAVASLQRARALATRSNALKLTADLALARCHARLGDTDLQLAACQRALVANPKSVDAHAGTAKALLACGDYDAALREFRRVAASMPTDELADRDDLWAPLLRLEYAALRQQRSQRRGRDEIDTLATSLADKIPADLAPLLRAENLAGEGKIDDAMALLEQARSAGPPRAAIVAAALTIPARAGRATPVADMVSGLPDDVLDDQRILEAVVESSRSLPQAVADPLAQALLERRPDDLLAAMNALVTRVRAGEREGVPELAARIASIAGENTTHAAYAKAATSLAGRRQATARPQDAAVREFAPIRKRLEEVVLLRPGWPEAHCLLAEVDLLDGRTQDAVSHYRRALEARPSDLEAARPLIRLLMDANRFNDAEQFLNGLDETALSRLGLVVAELRLRSGRTDEALAIVERELKSGADDPDQLAALAMLLARNDRDSVATTALQRAVSLAPDRADLWLALVDRKAASEAANEAVTILERAVTSVAEISRPLLQAEIARHAGRRDEAATSFRRLLERPGAGVLTRRRAIECFLDAGSPDEARATLETLLEPHDGTTVDQETARWARRRLGELDIRDGSFTAARKALKTLSDNAGGAGDLTPEDADLAARLLAERPEPESWRLAVGCLESLANQQRLTVSQQVLAARLRARLGNWRRGRDDLRALAVQKDAPTEVLAAFIDILIEHEDLSSAATWLGELAARAADAPETIALEARLALAKGDKAAAIAAAKRLMPDRDVTPDSVASALAVASSMERLGFLPAAENLLTRAAAASSDGILPRIEFLLRRNRGDEAADALDACRDSLGGSPDFVLQEARLLELRERPADAEQAYRRLLDDVGTPTDLRAAATARLAWCLMDREQASEAFTLVDRAIVALGPLPDLLDARGMARLAQGNAAGAMNDLADAALAPTPARLLHRAYAKAVAGEQSDALAILQQAAKPSLDISLLRPSDRQRLEALVQRLGITIR